MTTVKYMTLKFKIHHDKTEIYLSIISEIKKPNQCGFGNYRRQKHGMRTHPIHADRHHIRRKTKMAPHT